MSRAVDLTVTGRVQGVAFRHSAAVEATRLGVAGWVRNEPDGAVAAHVEGAEDAVEAMVAWCRTGPPSARVAGVDVVEAAVTGASSFEVTG
ncbi:acylphosphatase [Nocardioides dongxiaopingii]|uniref:acylphosphatase n=1 Tax=Nocardioides dongxiaopingii TaxID=2576036 RepID=UPI0010C76D07|nr:acylphosphatase [Nocardioides dongxiaopingii]